MCLIFQVVFLEHRMHSTSTQCEKCILLWATRARRKSSMECRKFPLFCCWKFVKRVFHRIFRFFVYFFLISHFTISFGILDVNLPMNEWVENACLGRFIDSASSTRVFMRWPIYMQIVRSRRKVNREKITFVATQIGNGMQSTRWNEMCQHRQVLH